MPRNQKLTNILQGRAVQVSTAEPGKLVIRFDDQSTLTVKTAGIADIFPPGGKIKAIQEDGAEFTLRFEDGSSVDLRLADPGASVAVRDRNNQVEYLGWLCHQSLRPNFIAFSVKYRYRVLVATKTFSYSKLRAQLATVLDEASETLEPIIVERRGKAPVALIDAAELSSIMETLHLFRSPANAKRLFEALEEEKTGKVTRYATAEEFIRAQRAKAQVGV
jgi:antitoxin YefM